MRTIDPTVQDAGNVDTASDLHLLARMIEAATVAYMCTDLRGRVLFRNICLDKLIGHFDAWDRDAWLRYVHPDDYPGLIRSVRKARSIQVAGKDDVLVLRDILRVRNNDAADYRWVSACSILQRDRQGNSEAWFTFFIELPSSTAMGERLRAAVADGETRFRALFDYSSDATLLLHNTIIVEANEAVVGMFGLSRELLVGRSALTFIARKQRNGDSQQEHLAKVQAGLAIQPQGRWEVTLQKPIDNTLINVEATLVRFNLERAQFDLVSYRDISERLRAEQDLQQSNAALAMHNESLAWLLAASARVYEQPDLHALADEAVRSIRAHYSAPHVHFALYDPEGIRLVRTSVEAIRHREGNLLPPNELRLRLPSAPDNLIVVRNFLDDLGSEPKLVSELIERKAQVFVTLALMNNGEQLGVIALEYGESSSFRAEYLDSLKVYVRTLTLAVAKARHLAAIEYQARHDALTGLHNRSVLHREFERWRNEENGPATLLLLDLDRFKEINDTLGHHVGDDLLCQLGRRIEATINHLNGLLCRLGGDEFAVLIRDRLETEAQSIAVAEALLESIRRPFVVNGVQLEISASIGVALYPQQGADSHTLLRFADVAMYEAKHSGAGVVLYDTRLDLNSPQRLWLVADLHHGIRNRELVLHYQPKLDLRAGSIIGCEALVRWQHPRLGLLPPDSFVPLAEVGETIHELTAYVIEAAINQHRLWLNAGIRLPIAINLSARNLANDRVLRQLERLALEQALIPDSIELEITETTLMRDPARAIELLERIVALGVRVSVDDFGTGYSSLAYLRRLPIHTLKIDRTFISEILEKPQDVVIVQSIISLGHNLGLSVVAEGVESRETLDMMAVLGCDQVQGYHLSHPLPALQVPQWLARFRAGSAGQT